MSRNVVPRPRPGSRRPAGARVASGRVADVYSAACPARQALDRLADKWSILIIGALDLGPVRFAVLRDTVDGVSEKMLTQTLRGLQRDGLVVRSVRTTRPLTVDYQLTPLGRTLIEPMAAVRSWAERWVGSVEAARARYDAGNMGTTSSSEGVLP